MGGKRRILVVDDEEINREMLGMSLSGDYAVLYVEDGEKALEICGEQKESLSLVLLDLMMPVMSGMEVLRQMKSDPALRVIPVIVITADQEAETRSLGEGAIDFIPKPYPQKDVILARVRRIIELTEDREMGDELFLAESNRLEGETVQGSFCFRKKDGSALTSLSRGRLGRSFVFSAVIFLY